MCLSAASVILSPYGEKPKSRLGSWPEAPNPTVLTHKMTTPTHLEIPLRDATRQKYLNYAMSVITSRALPDVRDGQKPVQRRILYAMYHDLRLLPEKKQLKCAKVVGEVLGNYHPHGDSAVYDAMVRMAQDFSLRTPLVDGHGNFGSLDGDSAAAYRYTEARLRPFAVTLLEEIDQETVDFTETFDAVREEPRVLPARAPVLLANGATGIAVGIATNIPPHNLHELVDACVMLIEKKRTPLTEILRKIKGPDFPTGGEILNTKEELRSIYETGRGAIRLRGTYKLEGRGKKKNIIITSIPYMVKKQDLVGKIRDLALDKKIPQIVDVRDESTDDVRVVLELKSGAETDKVLAYIYKTTDLSTNFNVNLTCLVPMSGTDVAAPRQMGLIGMLKHFCDFRFQTTQRRFEFELRKLQERIHILNGFVKIFDDLDQAIAIIRSSSGKKDAATGLMEFFLIDDVQAAAILELMLYRIASLEIQRIREELAEKQARADAISKILSSDARLWTVVKKDLKEVASAHGNRRRTFVVKPNAADLVEVSDDDFIIDEDQFVTLSAAGRVKRVGKIASIDKVPVKQGDSLVAVAAGSTRDCILFLSNKGVAYTARINDIPATRGFGDPIQKLFRFKDGERVIAMLSLDPRSIGNIKAAESDDLCPEVHGAAIASTGHGLRFALWPFAEPSKVSGRKFARVADGGEIVAAFAIEGDETMICVSEKARALLCAVEELKYLEGTGRGVYVLKVAAGDRVIAATVASEPHKGLTAVTNAGATHNINARRYRVTGRAGKGIQIIKRGSFVRVEQPELVATPLKRTRRK